jgi:hypothetical protein
VNQQGGAVNPLAAFYGKDVGLLGSLVRAVHSYQRPGVTHASALPAAFLTEQASSNKLSAVTQSVHVATTTWQHTPCWPVPREMSTSGATLHATVAECRDGLLAAHVQLSTSRAPHPMLEH